MRNSERRLRPEEIKPIETMEKVEEDLVEWKKQLERGGFTPEEINRMLFSGIVERGAKNSEEYISKQYGGLLPPEARAELRRTLFEIHKKKFAEQESEEKRKEARGS